MKIKQPPCYDISHHKKVNDFTRIEPRPLLIITKATEGVPGVIGDIDSKFSRFYPAIKQAGYNRGAYHFHRKAYPAIDQVRHFLKVVGPWLEPKDLLILDVEETGVKAADILTFFAYIQRNLYNPVMLYSRKNILEPISTTPKQIQQLKRIPIWTAGYPYFPDFYSTIPTSYMPDPNRFGPTWLWQYSDKGQVQGIVGDVDLNLIGPELLAILKPVTQGEPTMDRYKLLTDLNMRTTPKLGTVILALPKDSFVWGTLDVATNWIHISQYQKPGEEIHALSAWCSGFPAYVEPAPEPAKTITTNMSFKWTDDKLASVTVDGETWTKPSISS